MSDMDEKASTEGQVISSSLLMGELLATARESKGLTHEDVANRLKLSLRQIQALETNNFSALPDAMITRGFIRNYAKFLELDSEPLLAAYRSMVPNDAPHSLSIHSANVHIPSKDKRGWMRYIVISAFFALLILLWIIYHDVLSERFERPLHAAEQVEKDNVEASRPGQESVEPLPQPALPLAERKAEESDVQAAITDAPPENVLGDKNTSPVAPVKEIEKTAEKPSVGDPNNINKPITTTSDYSGPLLKISLTFSGDSWVHVIDGAGHEIFSKLEHEGAVEQVEGQPPLKVVLGNALVSQLVYKNKPIDLAPYTKLNVAKLTLSLE